MLFTLWSARGKLGKVIVVLITILVLLIGLLWLAPTPTSRTIDAVLAAIGSLLKVTLTANPGGPYTVMLGDTVTINAACTNATTCDWSNATKTLVPTLCTVTNYQPGSDQASATLRCDKSSAIPSGATSKSYTLTLTASASGRSVSKSTTLTIKAPAEPTVADFSVNQTSGTAPLAVTFTNASKGTGLSYRWDFGDGQSSTSASPAHTYQTDGSYTAKLTTTGEGGTDSKTSAITVEKKVVAPVAGFTLTPTTGVAPVSVTFTNTTTGDSPSYRWDFGDGQSSTSATPAHTYSVAGTFTVTLTATNAAGSNSSQKTVTITTAPPVAGFSATPESGAVPLTVTLTNQTSGDVTAYAWTFGDGQNSTATNPTHTYSVAGSYSVGLSATGPGGVSSFAKIITALAPVDLLPNVPALFKAPAGSTYATKRFYADSSPFNTKVSASAEIDPLSDQIIQNYIANAYTAGDLGPSYTLGTYEWTVPVNYCSFSAAPKFKFIAQDGHTLKKASYRIFNTYIDPDQNNEVTNVPVCAGLFIDPTNDSHFCEVDTDAGSNTAWCATTADYDSTNSVYYASSLSKHDLATTKGVELPQYQRAGGGAGIVGLQGLVRPEDFAKGTIDHALSFGIHGAAKGWYVYPANRTDGVVDCPDKNACLVLPEGARMILRRDFPETGLTKQQLMIVRALKDYGMILNDQGASFGSRFQNLGGGGYKGISYQRWQNILGTTGSPTLFLAEKIHLKDFRVLKLDRS